MPTTSFMTVDRKQCWEEAQAAPTVASPYPKQAKPLDAHMFLYGFKLGSQLSFKLAPERALMKILTKHSLPYTVLKDVGTAFLRSKDRGIHLYGDSGDSGEG